MATPDPLAGPSLPPAGGGAPRQLVVLLHGFGADGNDLIGLAPYFARALPEAEFLSPHAPYPCRAAGFGRQWFDVYDSDPAHRLPAIRHAATLIDAFLDAELAARGLTDRNLALIGFSQGTMMSLFVAPRRLRPCAGVVGYSGRLESPELLGTEIRVRPPMLLVHGDRDELLPVALLDSAAATLAENGIAVEHHLRPGLGHSIDEEGIALATAFLSRTLLS
jgi:phospholipase/carboxylesterase